MKSVEEKPDENKLVELKSVEKKSDEKSSVKIKEAQEGVQVEEEADGEIGVQEEE